MRLYRFSARFADRDPSTHLDLCSLTRMYGVALRKAAGFGLLFGVLAAIALVAIGSIIAIIAGPAISLLWQDLPADEMLSYVGTTYATLYGVLGVCIAAALLILGMGAAVHWASMTDIPIVWHIGYGIEWGFVRLMTGFFCLVIGPFWCVWKVGLFGYRFFFEPDMLSRSPTFVQVASLWVHGLLHGICFQVKVVRTA